VEKKSEHPYEAATRELLDLVEIIVLDWLKQGPSRPDSGPPPMPGSWPTSQLKRLLNLAAEKQKIYAYIWILQRWLMRHGVYIPPGIFSKNIAGPGTGPKPSKKKRADGEKAWARQVGLIFGDTDGLSDSELARRARLIWELPPSFKAAQIAQELFEVRYLKNKSATRKYVAEAIALVKPDSAEFVEKYIGGEAVDAWLDTFMGAKPPFN
jgi:hypothetical protein